MFILLQILDVLTTIIGLRLGAGEVSALVGRLMQLGLRPGLMIIKILAVYSC